MSALQKGETVLITGATGWIGSHIAHEALAAGLKIKLAIRNEAKAKTVIDALEKIHGKGHIETVIVKDFVQDGAYDEAIKDVQAVVHAASDVSFSDEPDKVIKPVLKAYNTLFEAADKQKSVRRLVLTSSSVAVGFNNPGGKTTQHLNVHSWNDAAVEEAKTAPNGMNVYTASKVLSERAAWEYQKRNNASFTVTSVNPSVTIGAPVPGTPILSTAAWLADAAKGQHSMLEDFGPQFHIDVNDVAKLHVLALTREDVKNERLLAFGTPFNYNDLIDAIKAVIPNAQMPQKDSKWDVTVNTTVDVNRPNELLKDQGGLRDLAYSVRGNLQTV